MKKILILSLLFISGWMSAQAVDLNKENRDPEYVKSIVGRSQKIVDKLGLTDAKIAEDVRNVIASPLRGGDHIAERDLYVTLKTV